MSDNGSPFVTWMPGVLTRFDTTLRELEVRHIRTQIDSAWTNGKIEAFWATLKSEVLDREVFRSLGDAEAALERFARYYKTARRSRTEASRTSRLSYSSSPTSTSCGERPERVS